MANKIYTGKLNLSLLTGTFIKTLKGKTAEKQCLCIPIEEASLFSGKDGVYLDIIVFENDADKMRYNQTHSIKQDFNKDKRAAMGDQQTPYLGNLTEMKAQSMAEQAAIAEAKEGPLPVDDDLPY